MWSDQKRYVLMVYIGYLVTGVTMGLSFVAAFLFGFQMRKMSGWEGTHIVWQLQSAKRFFFFSVLLLGFVLVLLNIDAASFSLVGESEKGEVMRLVIIFFAAGSLFLWFAYRMLKGLVLCLKNKEIMS